MCRRKKVIYIETIYVSIWNFEEEGRLFWSDIRLWNVSKFNAKGDLYRDQIFVWNFVMIWLTKNFASIKIDFKFNIFWLQNLRRKN